jgi:signal transduction histidine kinase
MRVIAIEQPMVARPPLSWTILVTLISSRALSYLLFRLLRASFQADPFIDGWVTACLTLETAAGVCLFLTAKVKRFIAVFAVRISLFAMLTFSLRSQPGILLLLSLGLLFETAMYVSYPFNCLACGLPILLPLAFILFGRGHPDLAGRVQDLALFLFPTLLFGGVACLVLRYREKLVETAGENRKLDIAVARLAEANVSFQRYAFSAEERSKNREREQITGEIHDRFGYCMTSLIMMIEAAIDLSRTDYDKMIELLSTARSLADDAFQAIRGNLHELRAQHTEERRGLSAIHGMIMVFRKATGMEIAVEYTDLPADVPEDTLSVFFKIIQEGLTNAFRHGRATRVDVILGTRAADLSLIVRDNGRGASGISEGIGMAGMRKRVVDFGGTIRFETSAGFTIQAVLPYTHAPQGAEAVHE